MQVPTTQVGPTKEQWLAGLVTLQSLLKRFGCALIEEDDLDGSSNGFQLVEGVIRQFGGLANVPTDASAIGAAMFKYVEAEVKSQVEANAAGRLHWAILPKKLLSLPQYASFKPSQLAEEFSKPKVSRQAVERVIEDIERKLDKGLHPYDPRWKHIRAFLAECRSGAQNFKTAGKVLDVFLKDGKTKAYDGSQIVQTQDVKVAIWRFNQFRSGQLSLKQYEDGE